MDSFTPFIQWLFSSLSDFLLSEPIVYFVCMVLAFFVCKIFVYLISFSKRRF